MNFQILVGRGLPIEADVLEKRALGGTETGVVRVAEELAQRGHLVEVITSHKNPTSKDNPRYTSMSAARVNDKADVVIAVQDWWPLVTQRWGRAKRVFWTGDAPDQYLTFGIGDVRVANAIEILFAVSEWQKKTLCGASGFPIERCQVIRNGIHPPLFFGDCTRHPKRMIFSTTPYRGLRLTVPIVQELVKIHPDLEYHVYSGLAVYDRERPFQGPEVKDFEETCALLRQIPQCTLHGNVTQTTLAQALKAAAVYIYPSIFPETSSIATIEAMAAGCIPVVFDRAALPETVQDAGICIDHTLVNDQKYVHSFVRAVSDLFNDNSKRSQLSERAIRLVREDYHWSHVTDRLLSYL